MISDYKELCRSLVFIANDEDMQRQSLGLQMVDVCYNYAYIVAHGSTGRTFVVMHIGTH